MSHIYFNSPDGHIQGHISVADIYEFAHNGRTYYFEYHRYLGPVPVRKRDLSPRKTVLTGFYQAVSAFEKLDKEQQEECKIL